MKTPKQLERHFKGVANHWRIQILFEVARNEGICLEDLAADLKCNMKTLSEHTHRLVKAGLIDKKYKGRFIGHFLSPYGKTMIKLLSSFS
jgi:DNA-binding MarR family transcriptional regulator